MTWNQARKLIASRHIQINGNLCLDSERRVKENEVVKWFTHPLAPPPREQDVEIVFVDQHLIIVDKPSGITSVRHASERNKKGASKSQATLEDLMPRILQKRVTGTPVETKAVKKKPFRGRQPQPKKGVAPKVFPVHRLDRDTSGLMIFAAFNSCRETAC
ncbi:MAG: pseudouridine synthase [Pirellulaceae bacterium]